MMIPKYLHLQMLADVSRQSIDNIRWLHGGIDVKDSFKYYSAMVDEQSEGPPLAYSNRRRLVTLLIRTT